MLDALKIKANEFQTKMESSKKKKKGSQKTDNAKKIYEQLEDNIKTAIKMMKMVNQDQAWLNLQVGPRGSVLTLAAVESGLVPRRGREVPSQSYLHLLREGSR